MYNDGVMSQDYQQNLTRLIHTSMNTFTDRPFLQEVSGTGITYGQAWEAITHLHQLFQEIGLKRGEKVVLLGTNSIHWGLVYLATVSYGAVIVPILANFSGTNVHNILNMSEARAVFASAAQLEKLEGVKFPHLKHAYVLEDFREIEIHQIPDLKDKVQEALRQLGRQARKVLTKEKKNPKLAAFDLPPDTLAAIIYTSGTTGQSKGVMLSHGNLLHNIKALGTFCLVTAEDRFLSLLPLAHTFECTVGFLFPLSVGSSVYYLEGKPTPTRMMQAFQEVRPTLVPAVPLIIEKIYFRRIKPKLESNLVMKGLTKIPYLRSIFFRKAVRKLHESLGGCLRLMAFGGAQIGRAHV